MFNDKYKLETLVFRGVKTNTRRIIPTDVINYTDTGCLLMCDGTIREEKDKDYNCYETFDGDWVDVRDVSGYEVGELVAIAQSYNTLVRSFAPNAPLFKKWASYCEAKAPSANNKMFVKAELMPFHIKITNKRVERLQDISDEDCMREGVQQYYSCGTFYIEGVKKEFNTPREAFAYLIDKVSGKGTWDKNPWVYVYDFITKK